MISVTDLRPGTKVKMDGGLWECVEYQHQKLGRGGAKVVAKFKNLETGATVERTFNSGEKLEDIYVETRELQYLYPEGEEMVFMDLETYEQFAVPRSRVVGAARFALVVPCPGAEAVGVVTATWRAESVSSVTRL